MTGLAIQIKNCYEKGLPAPAQQPTNRSVLL
jgi:hypothetical protein